MNMLLLIECISVITGLAYVILLMKEQIWCWAFGIISSALSIYLFVETNLYAEAILYLYYVIIGIYAWITWNKKNRYEQDFSISVLNRNEWLMWLGIGLVSGLSLAFIFSFFTDAARPLVDSFTTVFAFIATYLQATKKLGNWIFWIGINAVSVWLYYDRGLEIYSGLMGLYFVLSIIGYINWKKKLDTV